MSHTLELALSGTTKHAFVLAWFVASLAVAVGAFGAALFLHRHQAKGFLRTKGRDHHA